MHGTTMGANNLEVARLWTLAVPTVSSFVASMVRDFRFRDDILQETAVAVIESFHRYDPSQSFIGWAIGIARNQIRLHFRRHCRERIVFDTESIDNLAKAFVEVHSTDNRMVHLSECVGALDAKSRELCQLRYQKGMKPAAIGLHHGLDANTVAKALQRIRERLRDCIQRKAGMEIAT